MAWERPQKTIVRETRRIAIGVAALLAVMLIVYALLGKFTFGVALGALMGSAYGVFNFFMLGMTIQRAGKETDEAAARARSLLVQPAHAGRGGRGGDRLRAAVCRGAALRDRAALSAADHSGASAHGADQGRMTRV